MKKKITIIVITFLILIIIVFILNKSIFLPKQKIKIYNNNETFKQTQEKNGITFEKIKCYYDGYESLISYTVSNHTNEDVELKNYEILVKDKDNNIISNIFIGLNIVLAPEEEKEIKNKVIGRDLSNAYKLELKTNTNADDK